MPSVAILMATYNGERFLPAQLDSFLAQTHTDWLLLASDDGSTDTTRTLLQQFADAHPNHNVSIIDGPRQGFAKNFLSLLAAAPEADYYAFSDQDDLWEPEKLARAVAWLSSVEAATPALYGARTLYVTEDNKPLAASTLFKHPPSFANALVQSFAGGNTMVMNRAARERIVAYSSATVSFHDWWAYLLVSGVGGAVHYDAIPCLRYRQHGSNLQGQNISAQAKLSRVQRLFCGEFRDWNEQNVAALLPLRGELTPRNQSIFDLFADARKSPLAMRLAGFYSSGIHRQTLLGNLGLVVAALTNRI